MVKNLCNKVRKTDEPYEIWKNGQGWTWHVLKKYQKPEREKENHYARWFCAVKSPITYGEFKLGDTYVKDVRGFGATRTFAEQFILDQEAEMRGE